MVLDTSLFNNQLYKVRIKDEKEGMEWRLSLLLDVLAIEKTALGSPSTTVANFTYLYIYRER